MDKSGFTKKRAAALCAMGVLTAGAFCGGMATAHLAKASETKSIALTEDLAAVSTLADLENTSLKLYGAIDWAGYGRIALNETNRGNFHNAYVNDVKLRFQKHEFHGERQAHGRTVVRGEFLPHFFRCLHGGRGRLSHDFEREFESYGGRRALESRCDV